MSFMNDFGCLQIQMKDIVLATNNFDPTKVIGRGGFGSVYKGELSSPEGKITCAFKRLNRRLGQGNVEFWKEIMVLSKYKHENLISLNHFCIEGDERILVYEYASRRSLDRYLTDATTLTWIQRLKICVGSARGLRFLHDQKETQQRLLHRDVKSANILLDENWTAKLSDFGLSKVGPANQPHTYVFSNVVGTPGYCDPLYMESGFLSKESDVYSFGVVLFEVLCGRLCCEYYNGRLAKILVPKWRECYNEKRLDEIILAGLKEEMNPGSLESFSAIAYRCVNKAREQRPTMAEIVNQLELCLKQQVIISFGLCKLPMLQETFESTPESGQMDQYDNSNMVNDSFKDRADNEPSTDSDGVDINLLSNIPTKNGHNENSLYFDGLKAYDADPFHPMDNPNGVIQLGLAENQISFDLIQEWIKANPSASICTPQGALAFKETAIFQDYYCLPKFRTAVANFMNRVRGNRVKFDPDRIVMTGGATGAHETLAFCLADAGEAFLVPTPYDPAFDRDLRLRIGGGLVPMVCESSINFKITREALETAYKNAKRDNVKVKGLLIANPSNPLGTFLDRETLKDVVNFINDKRIHLVCDEIYAGTVTNGDDFVSIAEVIKEEPECNLDLIHLVYCLSKDMGFPGLGVGIVYSYNDSVMRAARYMSRFGLVSIQAQYMLASMLSDNNFVKAFVTEIRRRLAHRRDYFNHELAQVGVRSLESKAGLFLWVDLRSLLKEPTFESEMTLWQVIVKELKLNVSPGQSFHCSEPGWFRVCFANTDDETTMHALWRIKCFVLRNRRLNHQHLRLSSRRRLHIRFSLRWFEDRMVSPHAPLLQSPLVPARN